MGMSLGIVVKGPEGLVLAAESRLTLMAKPPEGTAIQVNFDNATKLLSFADPHCFVGAVTYGAAAIGLRTANSFVAELESQLPRERLPVLDFAKKMRDFYLQQWNSILPESYKGSPMTFVVAGFDPEQPYGRVFKFDIPSSPEPEEYNAHPQFGITWGGQREFVDRLIRGYDHNLLEVLKGELPLTSEQVNHLEQRFKQLEMQIPLQTLPLQDCVDLAIFFVKTTISAQKLTVGIRGCGGAIDVATITRGEGLRFVQRKQIVGERDT
jgi:20S proteasome alpha/beta subunit